LLLAFVGVCAGLSKTEIPHAVTGDVVIRKRALLSLLTAFLAIGIAACTLRSRLAVAAQIRTGVDARVHNIGFLTRGHTGTARVIARIGLAGP
jgi:hypothetical protein